SNCISLVWRTTLWCIPNFNSTVSLLTNIKFSAIMEFIVTSPEACNISDIPDISLPDYLLQRLRTNLLRLGSKPWMVDVATDCEVRFDEVEDMSLRFASALTRRGFRRGDVLYYVTVESAQLFVVLLAVWRLGGATRGWWQYDTPEVYADHLQECNPTFVLVDEKTSSKLYEAITMVGRQFDVLCFGKVDGATSVNELFQDDGSAFPENVEINPKEDVVLISNTSGTTSKPKGVLHSHFAAVAVIHGGTEYLGGENSSLVFMGNFSIGHFVLEISSLYSGGTRYNIPSLLTNQDSYFDSIMKYKPDGLHLFPYIATWIARSQKFQELDLSFLKVVAIGAAPLDNGTVELFQKTLPQVLIQQIVDLESGKTQSAGQMGEICMNSPSLFMGYLKQGQQVVPSDLEAMLHENPSVQGAAVIGIPDSFKTNLIRAYIVLKPGHHATAEDLIKFLDDRVPENKRLTGGVRFVKNLPANRNGKLDRRSLIDMALAEK
ncbi:hypothetical protein B566_EDAN001328, partial [Ephemera danica]